MTFFTHSVLFLLSILLSFLVYSNEGFANEKKSLDEKSIDDRWTVAVMDKKTKDPKQWEVIASVNGKVIHGARLQIRLLPKGDQSCSLGNTFTYFYADSGNKNTGNLQNVIIPAEFKNEPIQVRILFAKPFLQGYAVFIDLGWNRLEELKQFFRDEKEVTLKLKDAERLKISEYFDVPQETWSLNGFNQALDRAKQECENVMKMSNPENLQQEQR